MSALVVEYRDMSRLTNRVIAYRITIWRGTHPVIILNEAWTANSLFERHADVVSSRHAVSRKTGDARWDIDLPSTRIRFWEAKLSPGIEASEAIKPRF